MPNHGMQGTEPQALQETWIVKGSKAAMRFLSAWVPYLYFLRFSLLLWIFPLLLVAANQGTGMRSLLSGIVTPSCWVTWPPPRA